MIRGKRLGHREHLRFAVIHCDKVASIRFRLLHHLRLRRHWRCVLLVKRRDLCGPGPHLEPVGPVETDTIATPMLVLDSVVIYIVNPVGIYVVHVAIVVKVVAVPIAAVIAITGVAVPVIDPTVVPDVPAPEAAMPSIATLFIAPVARRP